MIEYEWSLCGLLRSVYMQVCFTKFSLNNTINNYSGVKNAKKNISVKSNPNFKSAYDISKELAQKGIKTDFKNNDFFARCAKQTVDIFEALFGKSSLPNYIEYKRLDGGVYGQYFPGWREVDYNSSINEMYSMDGLKKLAKSGYNFLIPNDYSSLHPAHTHVHEFAHSAHHRHLDYRHSNNGSDIMDKLRNTQVPTAIGRLITRFKLGNYALDKNGGMNEFMAERISQDVTKGLTDEYWIKYKDIDVDYTNIFDRKWNYRYSSPQSYLDYFTQQVWNGDIEEAKKAGNKIEEYLRDLDAARVPVSVQTVTVKARGSIFEGLMEGISGVFETITDKLDNRNRLMIRE